jgi:hypothetical protein
VGLYGLVITPTWVYWIGYHLDFSSKTSRLNESFSFECESFSFESSASFSFEASASFSFGTFMPDNFLWHYLTVDYNVAACKTSGNGELG